MNLLLPHRRRAFQAPPSTGFPTDQLQLFWKFDEASGGAIDSWGTVDLSETGTINSVANEGPQGDATVRWLTTSNNNYFQSAARPEFTITTEDFTLTGWVKCYDVSAGADYNAFQRANNTSPGWSVVWDTVAGGAVRTDQYFRLTDSSTSVNFTNQRSIGVNVDTWFHFAWVANRAGDMELYINGATTPVDAVDISSLGSLTNTNWLRIGRSGGSGQSRTHISHWGFWKKALSESERTAVYNGGILTGP